jgi:hypothetical protein
VFRIFGSYEDYSPSLVCTLSRLFCTAVVLAAAIGATCAQKLNLPQLIAQNPDLQLLAAVLGSNGLIPTLSGYVLVSHFVRL